MSSNGEIQNINDLIHKVFNNISLENSGNANKIVSSWESVLSKIKSMNNSNEGQNLIDHSRIIDLKNGVLLIEADHPGWISLLQIHKKFILKGMQMSVPDVKISSLAFRLSGSQSSLSSSGFDKQKNDNIVRNNIEKRIEIEENNLSKFNASPQEIKSYKTEELAPELAEIFKDLKKSMLTNSKK